MRWVLTPLALLPMLLWSSYAALAIYAGGFLLGRIVGAPLGLCERR